jgi:hypothetical protein
MLIPTEARLVTFTTQRDRSLHKDIFGDPPILLRAIDPKMERKDVEIEVEEGI